MSQPPAILCPPCCPHSSLGSVPVIRLSEPVSLFSDLGYFQTSNLQDSKAELGSTHRWGGSPSLRFAYSLLFCYPSPKPGHLCPMYYISCHEEFLPCLTFSPLTRVSKPIQGVNEGTKTKPPTSVFQPKTLLSSSNYKKIPPYIIKA